MVLIIDDDAKYGSLLEKLFRYAGLEAVAISGGMEAISLLHLRQPTLIILDLAMKPMDGMTVLRAIRQDPDYARVPIMVHTVDFTEESRSRAIESGAQAYLVKGTVGWDAILLRAKELLGDAGPRLRYVE